MNRPGVKGGPKVPGSGRKKGQQNKTTLSFKNLILKAQEAMGDDHYLEWATANPTEHYKIMAKLLPQEITGNLATTVVVERALRVGAPGSAATKTAALPKPEAK